MLESDADKISDFLIWGCRDRGELLTNLKLQKLLYYAQAWFLVLKGKALFSEDFQAWIHGPVLPSQYHRFKKYEWRPIDGEISRPTNITEEVIVHLCEIIDVFSVETAAALELMTHNEAPWKDARKNVLPDQQSRAIISKESMITFYSLLNEKNQPH